MSTTYLLFVQCALGLEQVLHRELLSLGLKPEGGERSSALPSPAPKEGPHQKEGPQPSSLAHRPSRHPLGGVELRTDREGLWKVCLASRVAENVRLRMKTFSAADFGALVAQLQKLPFRAYLTPGTAVRVHVSCQKSRLWHSGAVAERVAQVLTEHVGLVVREGEEAQEIFVRVADDQVQVSLDVSGPRLSRRGYRPHVEKASLRESLAAALVAHLPDQTRPGGGVLWDPFCGAGTIVLEAMHAASGRLPGAERRFAFQGMRNFEEAPFLEYRRSLIEQAAATQGGSFWRAIGSDSNEKAVAAALHNRRVADLGQRCEFLSGDIEAVVEQVPEGAVVVTNPPYGKRLGRGQKASKSSVPAQAIFKLLRVLEQRPDLSYCVALVGGEARELLPKSAPALFRSKNGGLPVSARLLRGPGP